MPESLAVVYHNDALAKERNLSPAERLLLHQADSGPVMEELHAQLAVNSHEHPRGAQFDPGCIALLTCVGIGRN